MSPVASSAYFILHFLGSFSVLRPRALLRAGMEYWCEKTSLPLLSARAFEPQDSEANTAAVSAGSWKGDDRHCADLGQCSGWPLLILPALRHRRDTKIINGSALSVELTSK